MSALEQRLAAGSEVRLGKREAQDVLQKLRARGAASAELLEHVLRLALLEAHLSAGG